MDTVYVITQPTELNPIIAAMGVIAVIVAIFVIIMVIKDFMGTKDG